MLITQLKPKNELDNVITGKVFLILCRGCSEVSFPEEEVAEFASQFPAASILDTAYICNKINLDHALAAYEDAIDTADTVLVFSCGIGVQTASRLLADKKVCAACNTKILPGFAGVTPTNVDCKRCGECYLNLTGGICPITACAKGLVNGQCGGAKNGYCEVDPTMPCGWERIERRLEALGRQNALKCPVQLRNFSANQEE